MAQTAQRRVKAKRREKPLGAAIGLGLTAILAVGIVIILVQLLIPGTAIHNFVLLAQNNASATLPLDPLYQRWLNQIEEEEALFGTPFSLLCGGLVLGWLAPSYASRRRVLLSGLALGFGTVAFSVAFEWVAALNQQNTLNIHEGGLQVSLTAPPDLILRQTLLVAAWTAICVLGTWLGLTLRERRRQDPDKSLQASPHAKPRPSA